MAEHVLKYGTAIASDNVSSQVTKWHNIYLAEIKPYKLHRADSVIPYNMMHLLAYVKLHRGHCDTLQYDPFII